MLIKIAIIVYWKVFAKGNNMKIIYRAANIIEAHIVTGMLKANDIEAYVSGHYLQGGVGEVSATDFANVMVADEDAETAQTVVDDYEKSGTQALEELDYSGQYKPV